MCFRRERGGGAAGPEGRPGDGEHPGGAAAELLLTSDATFSLYSKYTKLVEPSGYDCCFLLAVSSPEEEIFIVLEDNLFFAVKHNK